MKFTIAGTPVAKGRPRVGKFGTYTPEKTANYETLVKWSYIQQCGNQKLEGPIKAVIVLYFPIPKSTSKKNAEKMASGEIRPTKKPDLDNCQKCLFDALNGLAYDDDSQIVSVTCGKYYSNPRAEVELEEIGHGGKKD